MTRKILPALLFLLLGTSLFAQISIIGTRYNQQTQVTDVVRWDASTGQLLDSIPTTSLYVQLSSSVFNAYTGQYLFMGITGLNVVNFDPAAAQLLSGVELGNNIEIDMANGEMFGIAGRMISQPGNPPAFASDFVRYDLGTGTIDTIGTIPSLSTIVVDAACYNSNQAIYYTYGMDSLGDGKLVAIPTQGSAFQPSLVSLSLGTAYPISLAYDNEYNILYTLASSGNGPNNHLQIYALNPSTGAATLEADFPQFEAYQVSTISFDQASSSFVFVATSGGNGALRVYNATTNVLSNGLMVDGVVNEFECDNYAFATLKYQSATALQPSQSMDALQIYPNPSQDYLQIAHLKGTAEISIYDLQGRLLRTEKLQNEGRVEVQDLENGHYFLRASLQDGSMRSGHFIKN